MENVNKEVFMFFNLWWCGYGSLLVDYGVINDG